MTKYSYIYKKERMKLMFNNYLNVYYYEENAVKKIGKFIEKHKQNNCDIVVLCIGSNNSNGWSMGSIVGSMLKDKGIPNVHGTLDKTINEENLMKSLFQIRVKYANPFIIAVSSDLGELDDIDCIIVRSEALNCELLYSFKVGNLSIKGIVNKLDYDCVAQMRTADLFSVYSMAKVISSGIEGALK